MIMYIPAHEFISKVKDAELKKLQRGSVALNKLHNKRFEHMVNINTKYENQGKAGGRKT
jgi:hypothetical protein